MFYVVMFRRANLFWAFLMIYIYGKRITWQTKLVYTIMSNANQGVNFLRMDALILCSIYLAAQQKLLIDKNYAVT